MSDMTTDPQPPPLDLDAGLDEAQAAEAARAQREAQEAAAAARRRARRREVEILLGIIALAALLRLFVYESDIVEGASMRPGLHSGDYLLVCKISYCLARPKRYEVVTFPSPVDPGEVLVKRVVGLPGEFVFVGGGKTFINGKPLEERYCVGGAEGAGTPVWVPPGHVFMLGDNRGNSEDSRVWGPIPLRQIRGKGLAAFYPFGRAHRLGAQEARR